MQCLTTANDSKPFNVYVLHTQGIRIRDVYFIAFIFSTNICSN